VSAAGFVHTVRPRYAEVDMQGVVFNAHWLTYFDEACTRFFEWMGYRPKEAFFEDFDVMVVKTVIEWSGPAGFDDDVAIRTEPTRLGTKSFDLRFTATVEGRPVCVGVITYVSVRPSTHESVAIVEDLRSRLQKWCVDPQE
jgi:acyl-CoA thioester hydrolase